jgi:low temperature requirement protein LtrA
VTGASAAPTRERHEERRVSAIELFFDLVFVFTLTQLTAELAAGRSIESVMQVVLMFVVLFWMYGGYAWLTNQVPPDHSTRRVLLILGMGAFLVCAIAIPTTFDGGGAAFGVGYLLAVLVHGSLYAEAYGAAILRFVPTNVIGALVIVGVGVIGGPLYLALGVAIALQFVSAYLTRRTAPQARAAFDVRPAHFVERHGLLLLIAFGESVVAVGIGARELLPEGGLFSVALLGLALVAELWWTYFAKTEALAEAALRSASLEDRVRMALSGYFYAYTPMLLGVVAIAAGVELSLSHITEPPELAAALLLGCGVAAYVVGDLAFRRAMRIRVSPAHVPVAVLAPATAVVSTGIATWAQLLMLAALLLAIVTLDPGESSADRV